VDATITHIVWVLIKTQFRKVRVLVGKSNHCFKWRFFSPYGLIIGYSLIWISISSETCDQKYFRVNTDYDRNLSSIFCPSWEQVDNKGMAKNKLKYRPMYQAENF